MKSNSHRLQKQRKLHIREVNSNTPFALTAVMQCFISIMHHNQATHEAAGQAFQLLNDDERHEFKTNPPRPEYVAFSQSRFNRRLTASKKLYSHIIKTQENTRPAEHIALMKKYPVWKLYLDDQTGLPIRTNCVDSDGNLLGITLKDRYPLFAKINSSNLKLVDRWPDHLSKNFSENGCNYPSFFSDPLGFLLYFDQYDKMKHGMLNDVDMPNITS